MANIGLFMSSIPYGDIVVQWSRLLFLFVSLETWNLGNKPFIPPIPADPNLHRDQSTQSWMALIVQNLAGQFSLSKAGIGCVGRLLPGSEEREQKYRSHITRFLWIWGGSLSFIRYSRDRFRSEWGRFRLTLKECFSPTETEERVGSIFTWTSILFTLGFSFLPLSFYLCSRTTKTQPSVRISKFCFSPIVRLGLSEWPIPHGLCSQFIPIAKNESHCCSDILYEEWPRAVSGSAYMWEVEPLLYAVAFLLTTAQVNLVIVPAYCTQTRPHSDAIGIYVDSTSARSLALSSR